MKKKALSPEDWEAERVRLSEEVKKAQQALWDHVHPVIEDPQAVADKAFWESKQAEKKSLKRAPRK